MQDLPIDQTKTRDLGLLPAQGLKTESEVPESEKKKEPKGESLILVFPWQSLNSKDLWTKWNADKLTKRDEYVAKPETLSPSLTD